MEKRAPFQNSKNGLPCINNGIGQSLMTLQRCNGVKNNILFLYCVVDFDSLCRVYGVTGRRIAAVCLLNRRNLIMKKTKGKKFDFIIIPQALFLFYPYTIFRFHLSFYPFFTWNSTFSFPWSFFPFSSWSPTLFYRSSLFFSSLSFPLPRQWTTGRFHITTWISDQCARRTVGTYQEVVIKTLGTSWICDLFVTHIQ